MSNLKRFLALALAMIMIVTGMAMNVSAYKATDVDVSDKDGQELAYAIDVLSGLGVIRGVEEELDANGNVLSIVFDGDRPVTRQEFALFTARIRTANPEWFKVGNTTPAETIFPDVKDENFFAAINDCITNGIINGYPDGTFKPTAIVTLEEAIKMLVSALGYTGLSYPMGYLAKAAEPKVALLGPYTLETGGFYLDYGKDGLKPSDALTRNDMAKLLYNYLLSNYDRLDMVWNAVDARYESRSVPDPVLKTFGIEKIVGYITGAEDYFVDMYIKDYNQSGYPIEFDGSNTWVKDTTQASRAQWDIEISYGTTRVFKAATTIDNWEWVEWKNDKGEVQFVQWVNKPKTVAAEDGWKTATLRTKRSILGFVDEDGKVLDADYLLGLKVIAYRDLRKNPTYEIKIPASKILGTKDEVDISKGASSYGKRNITTVTTVPVVRVNEVSSITLPTTPDGDVIKYLQANWGDYYDRSDLQNYHLYMFNDHPDENNLWTELSWNGGYYGEEGGRYRELAKFAGNKANYRLEYVYNGIQSDGLPEFFYIFRPFRVGVRVADDNGIRMSRPLQANGGEYRRYETRAGYTPLKVNDKASGEKVDFTVGDCYFYTWAGVHLDIYGKLDKKEKLIVTDIRGYNATFNNLELAVFNFDNSSSRALGAFELAHGRLSVGHTYTLFYDPETSKAIYARRTAQPPAPQYSPTKYGVVVDVVTGTGGPAPGYVSGGVGFVARIFDAQTGLTRNIVITQVDANYNNATSAIVAGLLGKYIRLVELEGGAYSVCTTTNTNFAKTSSDETVAGVNEYFNGVVGSPTSIDPVNNIFPAASSIITGDSSVGYDALTLAHIQNQALVNSNTKIVLYSSTVTPATVSNTNPYAVFITPSQLRSFLTSTTSFQKDLVFVGRTPYVGQANYIFLTTTKDNLTSDVIINNEGYGVLSSPLGQGTIIVDGKQYNTSVAMMYRGAKLEAVDVYSTGSLPDGAFVKLTGGADVKHGDYTYKEAKVLDSSLEGTSWKEGQVDIWGRLGSRVGEFNGGAKVSAILAAAPSNGTNTFDDGNIIQYIGKVVAYNEGNTISIDTGSTPRSFALDGKNTFRVLVAWGTDKVASVAPDTGPKAIKAFTNADYRRNDTAPITDVTAVIYTDKSSNVVVSVTLIVKTSGSTYSHDNTWNWARLWPWE